MKNVQAYLGKWVTVVCRDGSEVWGLVEFFTPAGDNTPPKGSILLGRGGDSYLIEVFCEDIAAIRPDAGQAPGPCPAFS